MRCLSGGDHVNVFSSSEGRRKTISQRPPALLGENLSLRPKLGILCAVLIFGLTSVSTRGQIFVGEGSVVGEYTTSGAVVNASLITGLYDPAGLAVDNQGHLFVSLEDIGDVAEYTTFGSIVNALFIQALMVSFVMMVGEVLAE
jgi:hypothetical protein